MPKKRSRNTSSKPCSFKPRKRVKRGDRDPEYPIASRENSFSSVGLNLIRYIEHDAFQDPILAMVLQYVGRFEAKPCSMFYCRFENRPSDYSPTCGLYSDSGCRHMDEARIDGLRCLNGLHNGDTNYLIHHCHNADLLPFLQMHHDTRAEFLKTLTREGMFAFEASLREEVQRTLHKVWMPREIFPMAGLDRAQYRNLNEYKISHHAVVDDEFE
jgi:hypothetical protein